MLNLTSINKLFAPFFRKEMHRCKDFIWLVRMISHFNNVVLWGRIRLFVIMRKGWLTTKNLINFARQWWDFISNTMQRTYWERNQPSCKWNNIQHDSILTSRLLNENLIQIIIKFLQNVFLIYSDLLDLVNSYIYYRNVSTKYLCEIFIDIYKQGVALKFSSLDGNKKKVHTNICPLSLELRGGKVFKKKPNYCVY